MKGFSGFKRKALALTLVGSFVVFIPEAFADQYASRARSVAARGHYAKARALLVEALDEFEKARKIARPDLVVNGEHWRTSVVSRAEDLNKLLDPRPRLTRAGVKYKAHPQLIRRDREESRSDDAKDGNFYGEQEFKRRAKVAKDIAKPEMKLEQPSMAPVEQPKQKIVAKKIEKKPFPKEQFEAAAESIKPPKLEEESASMFPATATEPEATEVVPTLPQPAAMADVKTEVTETIKEETVEEDFAEEDPEVAKAIMDAVQQRLTELEGME